MNAAAPHPPQKVSFSDFRQLKSDLIWVYEDEVLPWNLDLKSIVPEEAAFFLLSGKAVISNPEGTATAETGEWIFVPPGVRQHSFTPGTRLISLHFRLSWPGGQRLFDFPSPLVLPQGESAPLYNFAKHLGCLVEKVLPGTSTALLHALCPIEKQMQIQSAFLSWIQLYTMAMQSLEIPLSHFSDIDRRMIHALEQLDMHPFQEPFREENLARNLNLSTSQFSRLFSKAFQSTPHRYLETRKLERALSQLRLSVDPVKQIAYDLGFGSLPHFSSWLRRKTGLSPRQIRNRWLHRRQSYAIPKGE